MEGVRYRSASGTWKIIKKKTRPVGGYDGPRVFLLRRRSSHTDRENPRTPVHILTQRYPWPVRRRLPDLGRAALKAHTHGSTGRTRPWARPLLRFGTCDGRGDFFNLSLKFAPTGSRTQDLRMPPGNLTV